MTKENQSLQLQERSNALIAIATNLESSREFERSLTVNKIIKEAVPMVELKRMVGSRQVAIALDVQLTRLVGSLNLKWNLNDGQIKTIVEDLIDRYPNESLEDFILCFRKARQGEYGELIRLDSPIVFSWMSKYLDEKYQAVEDELKKEGQKHAEVIQPPKDRDWMKVWQESIDSLPQRKVPPLTEKEIEREGRAKAIQRAYHASPEQLAATLKEHTEKMRTARKKYFLEHFPDASEEEVEAYVNKFSDL